MARLGSDKLKTRSGWPRQHSWVGAEDRYGPFFEHEAGDFNNAMDARRQGSKS